MQSSKTSTEIQKHSDKRYKKLYEFWNEIPVIKTIYPDEYNTLNDHHYRNAMIQVLRRGLKESNGKTRYAMSLKEMVKPMEAYIKKQHTIDETIKITALYHHRDILLEVGLLQEVDTILEGKRYVTYYGRTSKAFIGEFKGSMKYNEAKTLLVKLLSNLHKDNPINELEQTVKNLEQEMIEAGDRSMEWIKDHVELINELELDAIVLYEVIYPFFAYNSKISQSIRELLDL